MFHNHKYVIGKDHYEKIKEITQKSFGNKLHLKPSYSNSISLENRSLFQSDICGELFRNIVSACSYMVNFPRTFHLGFNWSPCDDGYYHDAPFPASVNEHVWYKINTAFCAPNYRYSHKKAINVK